MANASGKRRINLLDFLLIILIIAMVSAAIVSVIRSNPNKISGGDTDILYVIKCENVNAKAASNVKLGDKIYDNSTNQLLGKVVAEPKAEPVKALNGHDREVDTGLVTLYIEINASVWKNDGAYSVDKFRIAEGIEIKFHSAEYSFTGICTSITEGGQGATV
jgi:hypothetical protein